MSRLAFVFVLAVAGGLLLTMESYRSDELQALRAAEQRKLLERLEGLNRESLTRLAADWNLMYPAPDEDRLQELRDLVHQLQADPSAIDDLPQGASGRQ